MEARHVEAAAAHFDEQGGWRLQGGVTGQPVADRKVGEAALLGAVDDFERDARPDADAIEKCIGVGGLADRARRNGSHAGDAVVVHHPAKCIQRPHGRIHRRRADAPGGEGIAAQQHPTRGLLEHLRPFAGHVLGDDEAHRRRADVDGRHDGWRGRCGCMLGP
jgi:hypothetical protein